MNRYSFKYLTLSFLSGFLIMMFEVYAFKLIFFFLPENSITISITLSSFLTGLGLSTLVSNKLIKKGVITIDRLIILHFILFLTICFLFFDLFKLPVSLFDLIDSKEIIEQGSSILLKGLLIWFILFIPAFFIGGFFPTLLVKATEKKNENEIPTLYFIDIIGGALGSLFMGLYWIPSFGLSYIIIILGVISLICILLINFKSWSLYLGVPIILISFFYSSTHLNKDQLITYYHDFGEIIFQKPSAYGVVTVGEKLDPNYDKIAKRLFINHRCMCSGTYNVSESELAQNTLNTVKNRAEILSIGLGCGYTANVVASSNKIDSLTIMEINPVVIDAFRQEFSKINQSILKNPKVNLTLKDGVEHILLNKKRKYDAIIVDIEEPGVIQSSLIYTDEYIKLASKQLNDKGVFSIWAINGGEEYNKILYRTMKNTFPYVVFHGHHGNPQLYGSFFPLDHLQNEAKPSWESIGEEFINTINNRVLEKSYSIRDAFLLPKDYVDDRIID